MLDAGTNMSGSNLTITSATGSHNVTLYTALTLHLHEGSGN